MFFFKSSNPKKSPIKFFANFDTKEQYYIAKDNLIKPISNEFEILEFQAIRNPTDFNSYSICLFVLPKDKKKGNIEDIKEKINKQIKLQKNTVLFHF